MSVRDLGGATITPYRELLTFEEPPATPEPGRRAPLVRFGRPLDRGVLLVGAVAAGLLVTVALATAKTAGPGLGILVVAVGCALCVLAIGSPLASIVLVLGSSFLRLVPQFDALPLQPFTFAFGAMIVAITIRVVQRRDALPPFGAVELLLGLFLFWNILSVYLPHQFDPIASANSQVISLRSFIQTGVLIPMALYVVGKYAAQRADMVRRLLWAVLAFSAYSVLVSILQFTGPKALVWPRYIVTSPGWGGERAVGVFNQPVINGLVLVIGFITAVHLATRPETGLRGKIWCAVVAVPTLYAIFLTHTRAAWLAFAVVLLLGIAIAPRYRRLLLLTTGVIALAVLSNWSTFVSDDRAAGGIGSVSEVDDRLNIMATALWAIRQEPIFGWGIARFEQLNTFHHQQWSPDVPWLRGLGLVSHENELGIGAELGIVGMGLWVAAVVVIGLLLARGIVRPGADAVQTRDFATLAFLSLVAWVIVGTTVDQRFCEFGNALVMLLAGLGAGLLNRSHGRGQTSSEERPR